MAFKEHYELIGLNTIDLMQVYTTLVLKNYAGETKPQMWWEKFECQITMAFNICDRT